MDWTPLRREVTDAASGVADLLRALPADQRLTRVRWTSAETGAHLVSLARLYLGMIDDSRPMPPSLSHANDTALAAIPERDPSALASLLTAEVDALLDALGPDGSRSTWYFTIAHTASGTASVMLTELLMHGLDLARAAGRPWPITASQATTCLRGILPALPLLADPDAALAATGVYHLRLRGSDDWTIIIDAGTVTVAPGRPGRADLQFSVDPVAFLLNSYGHLGRATALLTGKMSAWGRRPWLATRFDRTFRET